MMSVDLTGWCANSRIKFVDISSMFMMKSEFVLLQITFDGDLTEDLFSLAKNKLNIRMIIHKYDRSERGR